MQTIASVGDRRLATREGVLDSSVEPSPDAPIVSSRSTPHISGRVYNEQGKPVPDATVRLAVGGEAGGKAVTTTTDRSGAFTLRGVRAGSSYTVIARRVNEEGVATTGRAEVEVPDTNVRITLKSPSAARGDERSTMRPARPSVAPVSNVEEADEGQGDEGEEEALPSRVRQDDQDSPAPEAEPVRPKKSPRSSPRLSIPSDDLNDPRDSGRQARPGGTADEDVNPLPPALDPGDRTSDARPSAPPTEDESVLLAGRLASEGKGQDAFASDDRAPEPNWDAVGSNSASASGATNPGPFPDDLVQGNDRPTAAEMAPVMAAGVGVAMSQGRVQPGAPARRIKRVPQANMALDEVAAEMPQKAPQAAEPLATRPTWGELTLEKKPIPLDESLLKTAKAASVTKAASAPRAVSPGPQPQPQPIVTARTVPQGKPSTQPACDFDPTEDRIRDLRLPDTQGRMVSLRDIDADLILLDFWGTICKPCLTAIPHLNDIQKTFGAKRVQVIGIACEQTPARVRAAKVNEAIQKYKIGYPVLVTSMDGTCPVQDALKIQYLPTMILIDRQGKIIRREQGANPQTVARMDRFILRGLGRQIPWKSDGPDAELIGALPKNTTR